MEGSSSHLPPSGFGGVFAPNAGSFNDLPVPTISRIRSFAPPDPSDTPQSLFITKIPDETRLPTGDKVPFRMRMSYPRFVRISDPDEMLIFVDGACPSNGQTGATAGCGFVWHDITSPEVNGTVSIRLEDEGPTGDHYQQTSNRAELRAVIAALQFRAWFGEGWGRLVIATDSEYVTLGATNWVHGWIRKGWKTCGGKPVKNRDLWELLLQVISRHAGMGLEVLFWRIPRSLNQLADRAAKRGAEMPSKSKFGKICGVLC